MNDFLRTNLESHYHLLNSTAYYQGIEKGIMKPFGNIYLLRDNMASKIGTRNAYTLVNDITYPSRRNFTDVEIFEKKISAIIDRGSDIGALRHDVERSRSRNLRFNWYRSQSHKNIRKPEDLQIGSSRDRRKFPCG